MQLLTDVPLYNDVMLPSTSDRLALPLSPLPPSEPAHHHHHTATTAETYPPVAPGGVGVHSRAGSPLDLGFPSEMELTSDFDLVEKLFAIDTKPKTPFTSQVRSQTPPQPHPYLFFLFFFFYS